MEVRLIIISRRLNALEIHDPYQIAKIRQIDFY